MLLSTMQPLQFEGHNVAFQCKGLDQLKKKHFNINEVNPLTNDKVIT